MSSFETNPKDMKDLLVDIQAGKIQLPDFQRGWVWEDMRIRELLVSVAQSFPVGAVMMLETGGTVTFEQRGVEGVEPRPKADGQVVDLGRPATPDHAHASAATQSAGANPQRAWQQAEALLLLGY